MNINMIGPYSDASTNMWKPQKGPPIKLEEIPTHHLVNILPFLSVALERMQVSKIDNSVIYNNAFTWYILIRAEIIRRMEK